MAAGVHLNVITSVERLKIKLFVWLGCPQSQVNSVAGSEARDGVVMSHRRHLLRRIPPVFRVLYRLSV